jgi:hypothetical protein
MNILRRIILVAVALPISLLHVHAQDEHDGFVGTWEVGASVDLAHRGDSGVVKIVRDGGLFDVTYTAGGRTRHGIGILGREAMYVGFGPQPQY